MPARSQNVVPVTLMLWLYGNECDSALVGVRIETYDDDAFASAKRCQPLEKTTQGGGQLHAIDALTRAKTLAAGVRLAPPRAFTAPRVRGVKSAWLRDERRRFPRARPRIPRERARLRAAQCRDGGGAVRKIVGCTWRNLRRKRERVARPRCRHVYASRPAGPRGAVGAKLGCGMVIALDDPSAATDRQTAAARLRGVGSTISKASTRRLPRPRAPRKPTRRQRLR